MCGFAGVLYADRERCPDPDVLKRMGDSLAHRGPDGEGCWSAPGIGLVHRRLAIIDLAGGAQPLANEDGSAIVVFNGEIYNFAALRAELCARGHRFSTAADTEVLVHLYEDEEERLVERLRGMFAFALWDRRRGRLLLARDRVGIKPLYVYRDPEQTVFASELKAILAHPGVRRDIDLEALDDFLAFGMISAPRSIFRGIEKFPPAHTQTFTAAQAFPARRYWHLTFAADTASTADEHAERLRSKLIETVTAHLVADVPVGAFLSGGIDSALIVGAAAAVGGKPLYTCSIGFEDRAFDELPHARAAAARFGTDHVEQVATADIAPLLERLSYYFDEPFADPSMIPTHLVSKLARSRVKVALSGDGGDEAFGGYPRYVKQLRERRVKAAVPAWIAGAMRPLAAAWPQRSFFANMSLDAADAYANATTTCRLPLRRRLLSGDVSARLNGFIPGQPLAQAHRSVDPADPLAAMMAADVAVRLPDRYLVKVDRASMAESLEVRPPFLDHELLELAARIPSALKVRHGESKWILKRAGRAYLDGLDTARAKQGFDMPTAAWLRGPLGPLFTNRVLDPRSSIADLIDRAAVADAFTRHQRGERDYRHPLWALLTLTYWADRYR